MESVHHPSVADLAIYWANFLIYIFALYFFTRKQLRAAWESRRTSIEHALNSGKRALEEANHKLADAEARVKTLDSELKKLTDRIDKEIESEQAMILAEASLEAQKIRTRSQESVARETKTAETGIQKEFVNKVVERVEGLVKQKVDISSDERRRADAVKGLATLFQ